MIERVCVIAAIAAVGMAAIVATPTVAQLDVELIAKRRMFPEVGAGLRTVRVAPTERTAAGAGRYYVLSAPRATIAIYNSDGQHVGDFPPAPTVKTAGIIYGEELDIDSAGRVYVADRGANAIKIFNSDGTL